MLNCTRRVQVERCWPVFIALAPTPQALLSVDPTLVAESIACLGFKNRRTKSLYRMTEAYLCANWDHVRELPGIEEYAARAWEIFVKCNLGVEPPKDGALVRYWLWAMHNRRTV